MIDLSQLADLFPGANSILLEQIWDHGIEEAQLTNTRRLSCYLAQWGHETAGFRLLREMGNKRYFRRYEYRRDIGNIHDGDGELYCGRGLCMLTGRRNYKVCGNWLNLPLESNPSLVETPEIAVRAGTWFWLTHQCNELSDAGDFIGLTRNIKGSILGLENRKRLLSSIERLLLTETTFEQSGRITISEEW
jgi:putative chitinase